MNEMREKNSDGKRRYAGGMGKQQQPKTEKRLLAIEDLRAEYGLGKGTAYMLVALLPHVKVGKRTLFRREDLEGFLERAAAEGLDIRALALDAKRQRPGRAG